MTDDETSATRLARETVDVLLELRATTRLTASALGDAGDARARAVA